MAHLCNLPVIYQFARVVSTSHTVNRLTQVKPAIVNYVLYESPTKGLLEVSFICHYDKVH